MARRKKKSKALSTLITLILVILASLFVKEQVQQTYEIPDGSMEAHFLDVGQGDSALFITEDGSVLFDASVSDAGATIVEYLKKHNVKELEYFVLTHPDADHIGGAVEVLENVTVKNIIMPDFAKDTKTYLTLLDKIEELDINVIEGLADDVYYVGDLEMKVLSPIEGREYENANNSSVVIMARFGNTKFLMTGDAEEEAEEWMLTEYSAATFKADVLKVGHHGSHSSTTVAFLKAVDPDYAVISCGEDNSYGHPHTETVENLDSMNVATLVTKDHGFIVFRSDGQTVSLAIDE